MQKTIIWKSKEYDSMEWCTVSKFNRKLHICSVIIGIRPTGFKVEYEIKTNNSGCTVFAKVATQINGKSNEVILKSDGKGNWKKNNKPVSSFKGCLDIDILFTPTTNTLPFLRVHQEIGEEQLIKVIYFNIPENKISVKKQKYKRVSENKYKFENVPNDFEAIITFDEHKFVKYYPGLFRKTAASTSMHEF